MDNYTFIILGATGDLAHRKLIPALFKLFILKKIEHFVVIGTALEQTTIEIILQKTLVFVNNQEYFDQKLWQEFSKYCIYKQADICSLPDIKALSKFVEEHEHIHKLSGNRLIYCSVPSEFFCPFTINAVQAKLIQREHINTWHRIIYEKPFGHDACSAHTINQCICQILDENQIYRIDHYLTQEVVSSIALIRFTNTIFEPLWNNNYIEHVQINLDEKIGVDSRGSYYDHYGALKDVVQNHMLEIMALIGMEAPEQLTGEHIRYARTEILKHIQIVDALLGQYEGYKQEKNINPASVTETFAAVCLTIDNQRWCGVPFFLKTGKCLLKKETSVHIKFKPADCMLAKKCSRESNYLTIQIAPNPSFTLTLNVKSPGFSKEVMPVAMNYCHSCLYKQQLIESYELMLQEVINGQHSVSIGIEEIEHAWAIIDTIKTMNLPIFSYKKESTGPQELKIFSQKYGISWRSVS